MTNRGSSVLWKLAPECTLRFGGKHRLREERYEQIDNHFAGRVIRKQINDRLMPTGKKQWVR